MPHGPEIAKLAIYIAGPVELRNLCGFDAEGCYESGAEDWMIVPGEVLYEDGSSIEEIAAHEYVIIWLRTDRAVLLAARGGTSMSMCAPCGNRAR